MKKPDVIAAVSEATGQPKSQVEKTLDAFVSTITKHVSNGGDVAYPNFGKFSVKNQAARQARNPYTGTPINVPSKRVVKFNISKTLKEAAATVQEVVAEKT